MRTVHVLLPDGVDDPERPSGGNVYDRRVCQGLTAAGWRVLEHPVAGRWPCPDATDRAVLGDVLDALPDGAVVLADGLVACAAPVELRRGAGRLRMVVLLHMPFGERSAGRRADESAVLAAAAAVVTTSTWTRTLAARPLPSRPRASPRRAARGRRRTARARHPRRWPLLCVAAVTAAKGYGVLAAALAEVRDLSWRCECVGVADGGLVDELTDRARADGIADRLRFTGPLAAAGLSASYATADVLVLPSLGRASAWSSSRPSHGGCRSSRARSAASPSARHSPDGRRPGISCRRATPAPSGGPCAGGSTTTRCAPACVRPRRSDGCC